MKGKSFELALIDDGDRFSSRFNVLTFSELYYLYKQNTFLRFYCKTRQL